MIFYLFKLKVLFYSRIIFFIISLSVVLITQSHFGKAQLDSLGDAYLLKQDEYWQTISQGNHKQDWQKMLAIGDLSRHHRYAELKNKLWKKVIHKEIKADTNHNQLNDSLIKWANKNKRNIDMQLKLADLYIVIGENKQADLLLNSLGKRFPDHLALSYKVITHNILNNQIERAKYQLKIYQIQGHRVAWHRFALFEKIQSYSNLLPINPLEKSDNSEAFLATKPYLVY